MDQRGGGGGGGKTKGEEGSDTCAKSVVPKGTYMASAPPASLAASARSASRSSSSSSSLAAGALVRGSLFGACGPEAGAADAVDGAPVRCGARDLAGAAFVGAAFAGAAFVGLGDSCANLVLLC